MANIKENNNIFNKGKKKYKLMENNNYKEAIFEDYNVEYFKYFLQKFCSSRGMEFDKKNFDITEFIDWMNEYIKITNNYADFLRTCDIDLGSSNLAEVGKGRFDSIITPDALEISEFSETFGKPKLIFGDIYKGLLIQGSSKIISLNDLGINTLITQNPNSHQAVDDFTILSETLGKEIAFGMYGNFSDKDIRRKTKMIEEILEDVYDSEFCYDTDKDNFYMTVIAKRPKIKILKKTLSL